MAAKASGGAGVRVPGHRCGMYTTAVGPLQHRLDEMLGTQTQLLGLLYMYTYVYEMLVLFQLISLRVRAPFAQALKEVDRGRPSGLSRRVSGVILAVCRA